MSGRGGPLGAVVVAAGAVVVAAGALAVVTGVVTAPARAAGEQRWQGGGRGGSWGSDRGAALYGRDCAGCHGPSGEGSPRGVPLTESGEAAAYYFLVTGRMPIGDPDQRPGRRPSPYSPAEIRALVAHVAALGDGPALPRVGHRGADLARGGALYRLHCASCHSATGIGGALAFGRFAPPLTSSEPSVVVAAVTAGPGAMPAFEPDAFTDDELAALVAYVQRLRDPEDRGGVPLGRAGRVDEALVALGVAMPALVLAAAWIARRARR